MDGVLLIDKPPGVTSHDVVDDIRRILHVRRVGHTGTLDPFATGVLVMLIGRATRLAQFLSGVEKEYEAVIRLGYATDTGDLTGKPIRISDEAKIGEWSREQIETALESLRGEIDQVPPMYSAKKQGGRKLYEMARRGERFGSAYESFKGEIPRDSGSSPWPEAGRHRRCRNPRPSRADACGRPGNRCEFARR